MEPKRRLCSCFDGHTAHPIPIFHLMDFISYHHSIHSWFIHSFQIFL